MIAECKFYNIQGFGGGDGTDATGANGVVLGGVDGGLIEFCESWNQGGNWAGLHLWQWESQNILWQFNEGYDHWTVGPDGGSFDCDGGSAFSTYQYNYSHDNEGQGMMACAYTRANDVHDCIFRYNISANDCKGNNLGAATFYTDSSMYNVDVYNNTFYTGPDAVPGSSIVAIWYWKKAGYSNINLRNNIFMAEAGKKLINYMTLKGFTFQDNMYWQSGEPLVITDGTTTYTSLAAWRTATGQEMLSGSPVGYQLHPQLTDVHSHPVLGPHNLANLTGYKLKSTSQCRDTGLNLQALFGINPGTRDYYGLSIPQGTKFDISAYEYPGGGSAPAPDSTPPAAPTSLTATAAGTSVNLDWADSGASDISHYSVKRSTTAGGPYTQIISNLNASAYSDKQLPPTTYYYVVTATDTSSNQSGNSNQASATVTYPGVVIFSDGFESGNFTAGGWVYGGSDPAVIGAAAYTGSYGASLGKLSWMEKHFSTVGLTDIRIRYMSRHIGDKWSLAVLVKYDTGEHVRLIERIDGDVPWHQIDVILPPKADNKPNLVIRFTTNSPGPSGVFGYVDNVEIWGVGGAPSDTTPPTPNPMTWATLPYATSSTSIAMTATTATDPSGVEYFFDCTTTGGHDSVWQAGTSYTDTGLSPSTQYTYRVQARDKSTNQNATGWSTSQSATTQAAPIFSDGFESGNFTTGGWTKSGSTATVTTAAKYTGTYGAKLGKASWIEKAVSTSGKTSIHLKYVRKTAGLDAGEAFTAQWYDGSTWYVLESTLDTNWAVKDWTLPTGANNNANFRIKFTSNGNVTQEYSYLDDVEVSGQ